MRDYGRCPSSEVIASWRDDVKLKTNIGPNLLAMIFQFQGSTPLFFCLIRQETQTAKSFSFLFDLSQP